MIFICCQSHSRVKRGSRQRRCYAALMPLLVLLCDASSYNNNQGRRYYRDTSQQGDAYGQQRQQQQDDYYNKRGDYRNDERRGDYREQERRGDWDSSSAQQQPRYPQQEEPPYSGSYSTDSYRGPPPPQQQQQPPDPSRDASVRGYQYESSKHTPIHYRFETPKRPLEPESDSVREPDDLPQTSVEGEPRPFEDSEKQRDSQESASPRNDAVTRYMSTKGGRVLLTMSSGTVGMAVGGFVGKSLLNRPQPLMVAISIIMAICTNVMRNAYGELSRALGLALIYAFTRTSYIRRRYPTVRHIKACLRAGPRRNFPPSDNPWNYSGDEVYFKMLQTSIAMAFIGSVCGGNLPLIPKWMGGTAGAAMFGFATTLRTSQGDLARTMGMRVVALAEEVLEINAELNLLRHMGTVGGRLLDKLLILDRKHRIKDRLGVGIQWIYNQASRTAAQVQSDMQEGDDTTNDSTPPREAGREEEPRQSEERDSQPQP